MSSPYEEALYISQRISIPSRYFSYEFSRSGGPGGQHVNTTDTRVRLRFDLGGCSLLREDIKQRLVDAHPSAVTNSGDFILTCDQFRSRHRNIETARERLIQWIQASLSPPKKRRVTKPTKGSKRRRLDNKKKRGDVKKGRGRVSRYD
jgi:ribosome-associated protein